VAYADLFGAGLTEDDIARRLFGGEPAEREDVRAVLTSLNGEGGPLKFDAGRYFLAGSQVVTQAPPDLKPLKNWVRFAAALPFVRYLGLTGALAKGAPDGDVDLFVVAASHRGYLAFAWLKTLGVLVARWYGLRLCVNYLVEEHRLELVPHDPFTAVEFITMVPLYDGGAAEPLWIANRKWVWRFCANVRSLEGSMVSPGGAGRLFKAIGEFIGAGPLGTAVNRLVFRLKAARLKRQLGPDRFVAPSVIVEPGVFKQHHLSHRQVILSRFGEKLQQLGIDQSWLTPTAP